MNARRGGFSLVEVLVASAVGAIVVSGAFAALARGRSSWAAMEIENRLHERAQYVLATLEVELQMAGYFAGMTPTAIAETALPADPSGCGTAVIAKLDHAIEVGEAPYPYRCAPQGRGYREGTDVLLVRRASAHLAAPEAGRIRWMSCLTTGCIPHLLWPAASPAPVEAAPLTSEVRDLLVRIFYVSRSADGDPATPALRVKSLSAVAGTPAFIDTEVMPGVDDLQISLEPGAEAPRTVQVTLGVRADAGDQRAGEPLRHLTVTRQFALRNVAPPAI